MSRAAPSPAMRAVLSLAAGDEAVSADAALLAPAPRPAARTSARRPGGRAGALTGAVWAGYEVGDLLGCGGMGEVYLARETALDRLVALKVMALAVAADEAVRRRWANEARALASVDHPQVVRVLATGEEAERPYLAMELLEGGSLAEELAGLRLQGRRHAPLEALDLALQAARGLAAAHAAGLVHRDIKPGNLMRAGDGTLKVVDFGLVRFAGEAALTVAGSALGTPAYMAPEQGRGEGCDARSDVYSLGCVLYELLVGRAPFAADSAEGLVFQHGFAEPELPRRLDAAIPAGLEQVCLACLQKDPARRYPDAGALAADLERLHAGLAPLSALFPAGRLGTGADQALRRLGLRRRRLPLAAAVLAAAAALGGGWWWWDARKAEVAAVRARLAPLAQAAAAPATAPADLARLERLAGADDPQVRQGRARLAELDGIRDALAALAGREGEPAARAQAAALCEGLAQATGGADPLLPLWRTRLDAVAAEQAGLRRALAELDRAAPATAAQRAAARPRLDRLAALAGGDDPELLRWRGLCAAAEAEQARLAARLERLDDPAPLTAPAAAGLAADLARLAELDPAGVPPASWAARLAAERAQREALAGRLAAALDAPADPAALGSAEAAAQALAALQALPPAEERRLQELRRARQEEAAERAGRLAALGRRCAVLDRGEPPPAGIEDALAAYEALAGPADEPLRRWRERLARMRVLERRLEDALRAPGAPPSLAPDAEALAELAGAGHPLAASARSRLAAAAEAGAWLDALLARRAPPAVDAARLAAAAAALGPGELRVQAVGERVRRWQEAAALADSLAARRVLPPDALEEAARALADAAAIAGADHPQVRAWARRLDDLRGPPPPPWADAAGRDRHGPWLALRVGAAGARLRWRPPGLFALGSPSGEAGRDADEAAVAVRLERGQWMADRECSQELWRAVMGGDPARFPGDRRPVEQVDQAGAQEFCRRLASLLPGCRARLPTEAEWEAAVRGGVDGPFPGLTAEQAAVAVVHQGSGLFGPAEIAGRAPGPLGLFDAHGNVWEWCAGGYGPQPVGDPAIDPAPPAGALAPIRGGSWADALAACRAANRRGIDPGTRSALLGFRFAVDAGDGP